MKDFQYITGSHPSYIENLYNDFIKDPGTVDVEMRKFFEGFDFAVSSGLQPTNGAVAKSNGTVVGAGQLDKEFAVYRLIQAYRKKGHLIANTNPIRKRKDRHANLELNYFGLSDADMNTEFEAGHFVNLGKTSLKNIFSLLEKTYAGHVGVEYSSINDTDKIEWLENAMEKDFHQLLPINQKRRILQKLNEGVMFEKFLHTKYIGQKRFSLEGGETTIAALDAIINTGVENDVQEVVLGMAHRGRLNVLANIMGKTYEQIFTEFEGTSIPDSTMGSGDVKYHLGFSSEMETASGKKINLKLCPNPSHLETVGPIVEGFSRSKADVLYESEYDRVLPILIHGDASVAGQGVVYELLQMSELKGYKTGGTIHFVINNQIGFTTDFDDARSANYCTSLAGMVKAPVLHVNGDDAEAVVKAAQIATLYRQEFNTDFFIDMVCYRRHGHNEGDEPKFTQPQLYSLIDKHLNPREVYTQYLLENGEPDAKALAKEMEQNFLSELQERLDEVKQHPLPYTFQKPELWWQSLRKAMSEDFNASPVTAVSETEMKSMFDALMKLPEEFKPLRKVDKLLQDKIKLFNDEQKIDWATGELLAYASLLKEGRDVRMSGQDVKRGTFSSRHAVLYDETNNKEYNRLNGFNEKNPFRIYNSLLSEYAVLGFEYGYSMANPNALVLWEAQFGDFMNGAQIIIDQYIVSAETKWQRMNGLVLLLPHGYEGQGPEHSSARMERFLQQCAELNIVMINATTAANFFHALRRQQAWPFRKPLVVFTPKANLRHPGSSSLLSEFTNGGFKEVYDDASVSADAASIKKVLLCTGKIYFDLEEYRQKNNIEGVAIVRLEQLYPLPQNQLDELYKKYSKAIWHWVQEEPLNMGAATYLRMNVKNINLHVISRNASAATATGYSKVHAKEQAALVEMAFSI